jgi:GAF domain-containing protein
MPGNDSHANGQSAPEPSALEHASRLLDAAKRSLAVASDDAAQRNEALVARIRNLESNLQDVEELLLRTERHAAQLGNLYVATYQLHASLDAADVHAAIADIAVNLLGAEKFLILLSDEAGRLMHNTHGGAPEPTDASLIAYHGGDPLIDAALARSVPQLGPVAGSDFAVAVPFVARDEVLGLLVVQAFLPHKPGLSDEDRELLDLVAAHAASALLAARAFHVAQRKLTAYQGLLGFMRGARV